MYDIKFLNQDKVFFGEYAANIMIDNICCMFIVDSSKTQIYYNISNRSTYGFTYKYKQSINIKLDIDKTNPINTINKFLNL